MMAPIISKNRLVPDRAAKSSMRHMAHFCVILWPEKALESPQCDTVLAQNEGRIAVMAKKPVIAGV